MALSARAKEISEGLGEFFTKILWVLLAIILFQFFWMFTPWGKDVTDVPGWFERRSGMHHYTDYGTGCEYVGASGGGLTPRLDRNGKHVCSTK
jgi:hypothetical protein